MAATIKDVAKIAGVSISTVSRVINNSKPVSPEVKRKVLEAIDGTGYKPNEIARTLVTKKSNVIGIIVTDLGFSYIAEMVRGIEEIGKMYDYDILLCSSYGEEEAELNYMRLLIQKQVEGIILISNNLNDSVKEYIKESNINFIYLSRYTYDKDFNTVKIDYNDAAYEMTKHLINQNHKRIAYVSDCSRNNGIDSMKLEGYKKAIEQNEFYDFKIYKAKATSQIQSGYDIANEIVSDEFNATAVFCSNDELAIGLINYMYDNNIKVPDDISVVGFGDLKIASILRPTLTTVKEPYYDIGAVAIRRIIKELNKENVEDNDINLPFNIKIRNSSKKI